ncbi:hypothetical protein GSI_02625 [Ganoderma sinense ZZ0214-1]|uniref:Uncharacterized protein n=1 Tax=Ganoderma sinense ZZ0214-1 TaxID=1077348 RepID=A0A2G8SMN5_9APHY|nr:hypothetical protein GSI_02625 [Ganoderma sinense ZZ0214-1]
MSDVPAPAQSQPESSSSRPRVRHVAIEPLPNPEPTLAFGFVIDDECRLRWARDFIEEYLQHGDGAYSREKCESMMRAFLVTAITAIPNRVYNALPDVPRVRWDLLPIAHKKHGFHNFVFALRDNSTHQRLHAPLIPEHIEAVRKALGLPEGEQPKWVRMPVF